MIKIMLKKIISKPKSLSERESLIFKENAEFDKLFANNKGPEDKENIANGHKRKRGEPAS